MVGVGHSDFSCVFGLKVALEGTPTSLDPIECNKGAGTPVVQRSVLPCNETPDEGAIAGCCCISLPRYMPCREQHARPPGSKRHPGRFSTAKQYSASFGAPLRLVRWVPVAELSAPTSNGAFKLPEAFCAALGPPR